MDNNSIRPSFYLPNDLRSSPYLGTFRHAPPEWETIDKSCHEKKFDGRLRGGGLESSKIEHRLNPYHHERYPPITWLDRQVSESLRGNHISPHGWRQIRPLSLVNRYFHAILRRVLLLDIDDTTSTTTYEDDSEEDTVVDDKSHTIAQQDEIRPILGVCDYQDAPALREATLDYMITQVDISRMAKNASRHLDVSSILALPTTTYRKEDHQQQKIEEENHYKINAVRDLGSSSAHLDGWSWQMVSAPCENDDSNENVSQVFKAETPRDDEDHNQACIICLETFKDGDILRVLPCNHLFHMGCIDHWLLGTYSYDECFTTGCPTCKKKPIEGNKRCIETQPSPPDGSVPSWAFERLGDFLAKGMETLSEVEEDISRPSNEVTINHELLDASALSVSGIISKTSSSTSFS